MFLKLKYPEKLIDSTIIRFHASQDQNQNCISPIDSPVRVTLSFKDQKSADLVRRDLRDLGKKVSYNQSSQAGKFQETWKLRKQSPP